MRLVGYIRVSRVGGREGDTFISPTVQRERIGAWANAHGHGFVETFEDLDQPGSRLERPGLGEAMALVEAGRADAIVVAKLDRFTRSTAHLGPLLERLRSAGGHLVSVNEGIDTSTPTGKLVADIMGAISEWELTRISENWRAARAAAVDRGVHIAGKVPLGYRRGDGGRLEPDPAFESKIRTLFAKRAGGESWAKLAEWLTGATGGRRTYTVGTVRSVIGNRVYLGEASAGGALVKAAAHQPLVSREQWEAANRARGVAPARSGRGSGLLSGILRCSGCRYAMKPATTAGRLSYRCKSGVGEVAGGKCAAPAAIEATVIEPYVLERFWRFVGDYRAIPRVVDPGYEDAERVVLAAEAELDAVLDRRLVDALGGESSETWLAMVTERRQAVDAARAELDRFAGRREPDLPDLDFGQLWPDLSLYEQRKLLASVFDCVFVRASGGRKRPVADRVFICMAGEAPTLPTRGVRWTVQPFEWEAPGG